MLKIKELRVKNKESQKELSFIVDVSLRTIQNYESGKVSVPNDKLKIIAEHYNVSVANLFDDTKKTKIPTLKKDNVIFTIKEVLTYIIDNEEELKQDKQFLRYINEIGREAIFKYFKDNDMILKK